MKYAHYMVEAERYIAALDHVVELTVLLHDDMTESLAREGLTTSRAHLLWSSISSVQRLRRHWPRRWE